MGGGRRTCGFCATIKTMINRVCALCGVKQHTKILYPATFRKKNLTYTTYSARRFPDHMHYRILRCERCGLVFSSPILPSQEISKFYRESVCTYEDQIPYTTRTYWGIFKRVRRQLPLQPKILEVGCGNGFFLEALRQQGINDVWGVEPSRQMLAQASTFLKKRIKADIFRRGLFKSSSFDIVCFFHVLDHVLDPNEFVEEVFELLRPGGLVLVVVHDVTGLAVKLLGERSPIFDIEHIYLFNKKTLKELFVRHGFNVIKVTDLANTYPLAYWFRMSGLPQNLKNIGLSLLSALHLTDMPFAFPGVNISLNAQRKF